ncbi:MAG: hypothetical protein Q9188_000904 [Gyalolechia gomerana]
MLVISGIQPSDDNPVPTNISGCDYNPKFSQGLGKVSVNNHTWTTEYDPLLGTAPYQIYPSISAVIGGNATGGGTERVPAVGILSDALRDLLSVDEQSFSGTALPTPSNSASSLGPTLSPGSPRSLSTGAIVGIVIVLVGIAILGLGLIWFLRYRRRRSPPHSRKADENTRPIITQPIPQSRDPTEVDAGPAVPEICSRCEEEMLARMYRSQEMSNATEVYEMPSASR